MKATAISKTENIIQPEAVPPKPNVEIIGNGTWTTSRDVAEYFGKRHCDVLRDIRNLLADLPLEGRGFSEIPPVNSSSPREISKKRDGNSG